MDLNASVDVNCGWKDRWTEGWTDGWMDRRKTGCLYCTLLKQVQQKGAQLCTKQWLPSYSVHKTSLEISK